MTGPLRVLLVTHSLSGGGAERFAATLANHLDRERFAPTLASAVDRRDYAVSPDVTVEPLGYRGLLSLPRTIRRLRAVLRELRPHVVLSNVLSTSCLVGAARAGLPAPPPWIARVGLDPAAGDPWLQERWARRVYPRAAALVSNSEAMADAVRTTYPKVASRVTTAPNPTDFAALDAAAAREPAARPRRGDHNLLAMGRLVEQKRPDLAVDVLAALPRALDPRLWWAGEGRHREATRERARALGVLDRVELLGFLPEPFPLVHEAQLFLSTSDFEGLPNALIETQGLGLPAVATRCPYGPDEIVVDRETGRLVEPGDREGLTRAARELLEAPETRRAMGDAARKRARARFGLEAVMPRWQELLAGVAVGGD